MNAVRLTFSMLGKRCVVVLPAALEGDPPANDADTSRPPLVSGVYRVAPDDQAGSATSGEGDAGRR
jgi:hypothetical protein